MQNWPVKKLGELIVLNYGKGISESDRKADGLYPIYGANGELGRTNKYLVEGDAIIVGRKGSAGEVTRVSGKFWPSDVTYYVFGNKGVDIDFLFCLFENINLKRFAKGIKPGINRNDIYNLEIPIPGIEEQKRIVKKLEKILAKIEEARTIRQQSAEEIQEIIKTKLNEIFDNENWDQIRVHEIADLQNGFAFKSSYYVSLSNTLNFRMSNIRPDGTADINYNPKYLPDNFVHKYSEFLLEDGDVVIAMTDMANEPKILGVPTLVETGGRKLLLNQRVGKFKNIDFNRIYIPFLRYTLSSPSVKNYYKMLGAGGLQINISKENILSIKIPLPSVSEQEKIVAYLDGLSGKVQALQKLQQGQLQELDALKQSVLHQAFQGEL